jgi:hypothetical protein
MYVVCHFGEHKLCGSISMQRELRKLQVNSVIFSFLCKNKKSVQMGGLPPIL